MEFDILQWTVNQGFAIAVASYLLLKLDNRLNNIENHLTELINLLKK